jgi:hypothetical protein
MRKNAIMRSSLAAVFLAGLSVSDRAALDAGQWNAGLAPPRVPAAAAPVTAERAIAFVDAAQAAAAKERGTAARAGLAASMQRHLAKVLPAAATDEPRGLELPFRLFELGVAPGDGPQLRLAKVCARQIIQQHGEQKGAPAIQLARAVASGAAFTRADYRPAAQARVLAAARRS